MSLSSAGKILLERRPSVPKKSPDGNLMSISAYARHRKVSLAAVQEALKKGRIHFTDTEGKWINPTQADRDWSQNTDLSKVREDNETAKGYANARAAREHYLARLAKLEFEEKSAKLIDADKVQREAFEIARRVRDHLLNIPDRISAELVGITDQSTMHTVLTRELNAALQELSNEL